MSTTAPKGPKHPMPLSSLTGWPSAWRVLDKIQDDAQRHVLSELVRTLGVQGAMNLKYAVDYARWLTGTALHRTPGASVRPETVHYIERRVREELQREDFDATLFPLMRKL